MRSPEKFVTLAQGYDGICSAAETLRSLCNGVQYWLHIGRRARDDLQDLGCGSLTFQRRFRRVTRGTDFRFGAFAKRYVTVDQHEAATRHSISPYLDHRAIGPRAFEPK